MIGLLTTLFSSGCSFKPFNNFNGNVYGPPVINDAPEDPNGGEEFDPSVNQNVDVYGPPAFDPENNIPEEVYGPPDMFE